MDEIVSVIEDLMRIADDPARRWRVNAFLLDTVVNRLLDRTLGDDA